MIRRTITTVAQGLEYEVTLNIFESVDEAKSIWASKGLNPDEVELGIINGAQDQNAKQGGKAGVVKALKAGHDSDSEEVATAIDAAQAYAAGYVIGAPRGGTLASGMSKTQAKDMGVSLGSRESIGQEELAELLKAHGITVTD